MAGHRAASLTTVRAGEADRATREHRPAEVSAGRPAAPDQPDPDAVVDFLAERGVRRATRKGWYRTDAHEQVHGTEQGRERIKVVERAAMLDASEA